MIVRNDDEEVRRMMMADDNDNNVQDKNDCKLTNKDEEVVV